MATRIGNLVGVCLLAALTGVAFGLVSLIVYPTKDASDVATTANCPSDFDTGLYLFSCVG